MLHDFLKTERATILDSAMQRTLTAEGAVQTSVQAQEGLGMFYDELIGLMKLDAPFEKHAEEGLHTEMAKSQGEEYLRLGYSVSEVIHSYGVLCQSITGLASERGFEITSREFQQLNLSLDTVIAETVTEYELRKESGNENADRKKLGFLAHELRNALQSGTIALDMIEQGAVGLSSNTGRIVRNSFKRMANLIDTAITEVRLGSDPTPNLMRTRVCDMMTEVGITAEFVARTKKVALSIERSTDYEVCVDRQLFIAALANLVQNAIKFTPAAGTVTVSAHEEDGRILVDVQDECGGLPEGQITHLFDGGVQLSKDKSGLGLGLPISRTAVERNGGKLSVKNLPGKGCIFTIDLPEAPPKSNSKA